MKVTEREEHDVVVLKIDGRLDAASSPIVERKIRTFIEAGSLKFLLNFAKVDYLSSAGMRLLLAVGKELAERGGKVVLAGVTDPVMEIIRMAGFERLLTICHTEQEAIGALS